MSYIVKLSDPYINLHVIYHLCEQMINDRPNSNINPNSDNWKTVNIKINGLEASIVWHTNT